MSLDCRLQGLQNNTIKNEITWVDFRENLVEVEGRQQLVTVVECNEYRMGS